MCFYQTLNAPPAERDTRRNKSGEPKVKPLSALPGPSRELIENGPISQAPFIVPPLTRAELLREQRSLSQEVARATARLNQIKDDLLTAPA